MSFIVIDGAVEPNLKLWTLTEWMKRGRGRVWNLSERKAVMEVSREVSAEVLPVRVGQSIVMDIALWFLWTG